MSCAAKPQLYSINEAARALGVSRRTVEKLLSERQLRHVKIGARTLLEPSELARFIKANRADRPTEAHVEEPEQPVSRRQLAAIHARASELDRTTRHAPGTAKQEMKTWAAETSGMPVESFSDLSYDMASAILDELATRLERGGAQTSAGGPPPGEPAGRARDAT